MERIHSVNPERIRWCINDFGITPAELAAEVKIAESRLEKALDGEVVFSFSQLRKIANYFGRGVLFFVENEPISEDIHTPQFRTLAHEKVGLSARIRTMIERVEWQRDIYLSLLDELQDEDAPVFEPPHFVNGNIPNMAAATRRWLNLEENNDFNSYRSALESRGILVFRSNGYSGKWQIAKDVPILGFSLYFDEYPAIFVRKQSSEAQQVFTLMHELAHLLLHKTGSIDDETDMRAYKGKEAEANSFAGHLLVPGEFLGNINLKNIPASVQEFDGWLDRYKNKWGISGDVIVRRLCDERLIDRETYIEYLDWKASIVYPPAPAAPRLFRHREPKHLFGDRFVRTVLGALSQRRITLTKASKYLDGLKVADIHKLRDHYAGL